MTSADSHAHAKESGHRAGGLAGLVGRIARALDRELPAGDVAELRRLTPDDPWSPAFFRVAATYLDLPRGGPARDEQERHWAAILAAMALLAGLHDRRLRFGRALAEAGLAELRLVRLLRARGPGLSTEVRTVARFLASKGQGADLTDLARLVLSDGGDNAEAVRRRIARDYYSQANT